MSISGIERRQKTGDRRQKVPCFFFSLLYSVFCILSSLSPAQAADTYASDTWAQVPRYIAVHPGTQTSVWSDVSRASITNGLQTMTAVGDGTYQAIIQLTPKATYNFLFFAKTGPSAPAGLQPNTTYYDVIPTGGAIQSGTQPLKVDSTSAPAVRYGTVGTSNDARRLITVPQDLDPGDTFYVYANFGERPITITNFDAMAVDTTTVRLTWGAPYGSWGTGGESFKAADVIAGGLFRVYRNTTGSTTSYTLVKEVDGSATNYTDAGLSANTTYYYVLVAVDAYKGLTSGTVNDSPFLRLMSDTTPQDTAVPRAPVRVRFKVHHFDWNYVQSHGQVVYMTREDAPDPIFARRVMGVIRRVDL
ncbi:MAG: hypothetical protein A3G34_16440 [Candidatus Lindowbacteria bacterium RIFCSPLOWO2_12_FULL_62_27]|nr:MAG: hypothetical protein A3G34_16440 [Candidatus Lindowbacteria bacterium RIFCSPLOWO2_12_FULL_62_27]